MEVTDLWNIKSYFQKLRPGCQSGTDCHGCACAEAFQLCIPGPLVLFRRPELYVCGGETDSGHGDFCLILIAVLWPLGLNGLWLNVPGTSLLAAILAFVILNQFERKEMKPGMERAMKNA